MENFKGKSKGKIKGIGNGKGKGKQEKGNLVKYQKVSKHYDNHWLKKCPLLFYA